MRKFRDIEDSSEDSTAPASTVALCTPNADGVFENFEKIMISGLPVQTCGEFYLAHPAVPVSGGPAGFHVGYFLIRRRPDNSAKHLPAVGDPVFDTREAALRWLVEEIAAKFFSDHKGALLKLKQWWAARVESGAKSVDPVPQAIVAEESVQEPTTVAAEPGAVRSHYSSIAVADIERNPTNPRRSIPEDSLLELAESIRAQGFLLQPIAVRDLGKSVKPRYRLIAGERRWLAHQWLAWPKIEAKIFVGVSDFQAAELALIENLQRRDLNAMEEAEGFIELRDKYGYAVARIAERTGKSAPTIYNAIRLVALPADVAALVRDGRLTPSHAKALGFPRWASRPAHCSVLATWAVETGATTDDLESRILPAAAARALEAAKLAVDVTDYRERFDWQKAEAVVESDEGKVWHLEPAKWKSEKKELDAQRLEAEKRAEERASARIAAAREASVNVKVEDLDRAGLAYAALQGADERYAAHLPAELKALGIGVDGSELLVCLKAPELEKLKAKEAALFAVDRSEKIPALHDRASDILRNLKTLGSRELAFMLHFGCGALDGKAFERQAVTPPTGGLDIARLAKLSALDLARVSIETSILNSTGGQLFEILRWLLSLEVLGLAEETDEGRESVLAAAAIAVFPKITTDRKILAEWLRAHAANMPLIEIARSYRTTVEDVAGALGVPVPA